MSSRRFEVTTVPEQTLKNVSAQPFELVPLVKVENEISPPPLAPPLPTSINSTRVSSRFFNTILQRKPFDPRRRATLAAAKTVSNNQLKKSSSADLIQKLDSDILNQNTTSNENEADDSEAYSTIQSNNYDTNSSRPPNKFLQELRLKRRELLEKAKNLSIEQRIAIRRRENQRRYKRAQDIFDVHFEVNDDDDDDNNNNNLLLNEMNTFTEESQEKIRNDIYNELNRQRKKQFHKHHRHLLLGRTLLIVMTSLFAFMSFTLIYVVLNLYDRAKYLDKILPENEFRPIIDDKTTNVS